MLRSFGFAAAIALSLNASPAFASAIAFTPNSVDSAPPAYRLAGIIEDECKLWNNGCHQSCNNKVPRIVSGGATIGGTLPNAPHNAFQRAQMMAQCQASCMTAYPLCKP